MDVSFEWFESLCSGLSRNPAAATKTLEQFRESEVAVDATLFFLSNPSISHIGTFQAVSILHRASIVRWGSMNVEKRSELRNNMIDSLTKVVSNQAPSFVVNKVMQVCASIWKRGWLEISNEEKDAYFQFANNMMQTPATSRAATALLRVTLEEFSQQSFAEINMQYTFHADAKRLFQKNDLIKVFTLAMHPLNILFSWENAASIAPHIPLMGELFKLLSELITWNFNEDSLNNRYSTLLEENNTLSGQCNKLPREWATGLIHSNFVMNLYNMYSALCLQPETFSIDNIILSNCALELRNLILCLPTIDGDIFHSMHEKRDFGNLILEYSIQLVQHFIVRSEAADLIVSDSSIDYEEGGKRQEQLDFFLSIYIRLINNHKLSAIANMGEFEKAMLALSSITLEMSKELLALSQYSMHLYQQYLSQTSSATGTVGKFEMPADTLLMNTWRGGILALSLDAWGLILENPTCMADNSLFNPSALATTGYNTTTTPNTQWNSELINWIQSKTNEIFTNLFQAFFFTFLFETLNEVNEEENEEDALIESRQTGDFLIAICTIGRVNFTSSLLYIHHILNNSITELQALSQQSIESLNNNNNYIYCIQALEKSRICIEFASYLCIDVFHENSSEMNKETPTINDTILFQLSVPQSNGITVLHDFISLVATLLQWETQLVVSTATNSSTGIASTTAAHPLESPYLLQAVYRFLTEYVLRFVDPDSEQYSVETLAVATAVLQHMHSADINVVLDLSLSCLTQLLFYLPLETDLAVALAQYLTALSASKNRSRLVHVVGSEFVKQIAQYTTALSSDGASLNGTGVVTDGAVCRLNGIGLTAVFEALAQLFVRAEHEAYFNQLCTAVFALINGQPELHNRSTFQRLLSALTGLAKCSSVQQQSQALLYQLFDACWPTLRASIRLYVDADDILKQYTQLLIIYSEIHISKLNSTSCLNLYTTAYEVFSLYNNRLHIYISKSEQFDEESVLFRNESCLYILELLNHLAAKDFAFTEDCAENVNEQFENQIILVLLHGFKLIFPIITIETMKNFPQTSEKFFSFLTFLLSSYMGNIAVWLNSLSIEENQSMLYQITMRLYYGSCVVEAPIARLSLQGLQFIALHQWKCRAKQLRMQDTVPFAAVDVLLQVTDTLLQAILSSTTTTSNHPTPTVTTMIDASIMSVVPDNSALLSWDRIDSLANTLITYIALDTNRFTSSAQYLVQQQLPSVQPTLLQALTRLSTAREVNLQAIDKANRQKFVLNFREFITQIKSLSLT